MNQDIEQKQAKLIAVEDGLAEFVLGSVANEDDSNIFFWPEEQLPEGIEPGDEVVVCLDFKNKEEKTVQLKQKQKKN